MTCVRFIELCVVTITMCLCIPSNVFGLSIIIVIGGWMSDI